MSSFRDCLRQPLPARLKQAICRTGTCETKEIIMNTQTLLIIIIVLLVVGGGGYYGHGHWF
jgi:hypothetical protein